MRRRKTSGKNIRVKKFSPSMHVQFLRTFFSLYQPGKIRLYLSPLSCWVCNKFLSTCGVWILFVGFFFFLSFPLFFISATLFGILFFFLFHLLSRWYLNRRWECAVFLYMHSYGNYSVFTFLSKNLSFKIRIFGRLNEASLNDP